MFFISVFFFLKQYVASMQSEIYATFAFVFSCRLPTVNIAIDHRLPYNLQTVLVFLAHHNVMTYFSVQQ